MKQRRIFRIFWSASLFRFFSALRLIEDSESKGSKRFAFIVFAPSGHRTRRAVSLLKSCVGSFYCFLRIKYWCFMIFFVTLRLNV